MVLTTPLSVTYDPPSSALARIALRTTTEPGLGVALASAQLRPDDA
jgi:hypothetical protein